MRYPPLIWEKRNGVLTMTFHDSLYNRTVRAWIVECVEGGFMPQIDYGTHTAHDKPRRPLKDALAARRWVHAHCAHMQDNPKDDPKASENAA